MKTIVRKLPDGELDVMQAIWASPVPCSRKDLETVLFPEHPMALTTLLTILTRLSDKGFVEITKKGRCASYRARISKEDYLSSQSSRFFQKLCGGSISTLANALCDSDLTKEELAELRTLLERDEL